MVHPLTTAGPGATLIEGMRVINKAKLPALKKAFTNFCAALGDENIIGDVKRVESLIKTYNFTRKAFVEAYSLKIKSCCFVLISNNFPDSRLAKGG